MAFTTPKTDNVAADGLDYVHLNKIEENIRMLAGGDNALPLSTEAATAKALAKRDANGDIAFHVVNADGVIADIIYSKYFGSTPGDVIHVDGLVAGNNRIVEKMVLGMTASYSPIKIFSYKTPFSGKLRIAFTLIAFYYSIELTAYGRIYKNGNPIGILRSTTSQTGEGFSEDLDFADGDHIEFWAYRSGGGSGSDHAKLGNIWIGANVALAGYGWEAV